MDWQPAMSTVTVKGQIVIPVKLRRKVGLKKGTRVTLEEKGGDIIIHPMTSDWIDKACGILKGGPSMTKALEASRAEDKAREEAKLEYWRRRR